MRPPRDVLIPTLTFPVAVRDRKETEDGSEGDAFWIELGLLHSTFD